MPALLSLSLNIHHIETQPLSFGFCRSQCHGKGSSQGGNHITPRCQKGVRPGPKDQKLCPWPVWFLPAIYNGDLFLCLPESQCTGALGKCLPCEIRIHVWTRGLGAPAANARREAVSPAVQLGSAYSRCLQRVRKVAPVMLEDSSF